MPKAKKGYYFDLWGDDIKKMGLARSMGFTIVEIVKLGMSKALQTAAQKESDEV